MQRIEIIKCKCGAALASSAMHGHIAWHKKLSAAQKAGHKVASYLPSLVPPIEECRCKDLIEPLPNQISLFK